LRACCLLHLFFTACLLSHAWQGLGLLLLFVTVGLASLSMARRTRASSEGLLTADLTSYHQNEEGSALLKQGGDGSSKAGEAAREAAALSAGRAAGGGGGPGDQSNRDEDDWENLDKVGTARGAGGADDVVAAAAGGGGAGSGSAASKAAGLDGDFELDSRVDGLRR
jgi:hypothetical protein